MSKTDVHVHESLIMTCILLNNFIVHEQRKNPLQDMKLDQEHVHYGFAY